MAVPLRPFLYEPELCEEPQFILRNVSERQGAGKCPSSVKTVRQ